MDPGHAELDRFSLGVTLRDVAHRNRGAAQRESRIDLERAIALLPAGYRTVLVLHDIEGYRHAEIAERLGVSEGTSKSQLWSARRYLRRLLGSGHPATGDVV
jgi:RNA polymerase sigma-70 factor (ECF subfamily)